MLRRKLLYILVLASVLLGEGVLPVRAVTYVKSATYAPVYTRSAYGSSATVVGSRPSTYQFQSTSTFTSVVGTSAVYAPSVSAPFAATVAQSGPRRSFGDDFGFNEEEDDPIGVVPDPVPVGEPFVLVWMAMLYLICHFFAHFCRKNA